MVTPMWAVRPGVVMPVGEEIRSQVAKAAADAKAEAVEKTIPVLELQGDSGGGYYFSATDRAPKPGEYKYMTQGMIRIGELATTFTILSNDGAGSVVPDTLRSLKRARHICRKGT